MLLIFQSENTVSAYHISTGSSRMFSKLVVVVMAALATVASASDLFTMVGMADDGVEACGGARQVSESHNNFYSRNRIL